MDQEVSKLFQSYFKAMYVPYLLQSSPCYFNKSYPVGRQNAKILISDIKKLNTKRSVDPWVKMYMLNYKHNRPLVFLRGKEFSLSMEFSVTLKKLKSSLRVN